MEVLRRLCAFGVHALPVTCVRGGGSRVDVCYQLRSTAMTTY